MKKIRMKNVIEIDVDEEIEKIIKNINIEDIIAIKLYPETIRRSDNYYFIISAEGMILPEEKFDIFFYEYLYIPPNIIINMATAWKKLKYQEVKTAKENALLNFIERYFDRFYFIKDILNKQFQFVGIALKNSEGDYDIIEKFFDWNDYYFSVVVVKTYPKGVEYHFPTPLIEEFYEEAPEYRKKIEKIIRKINEMTDEIKENIITTELELTLLKGELETGKIKFFEFEGGEN